MQTPLLQNQAQKTQARYGTPAAALPPKEKQRNFFSENMLQDVMGVILSFLDFKNVSNIRGTSQLFNKAYLSSPLNALREAALIERFFRSQNEIITMPYESTNSFLNWFLFLTISNPFSDLKKPPYEKLYAIVASATNLSTLDRLYQEAEIMRYYSQFSKAFTHFSVAKPVIKLRRTSKSLILLLLLSLNLFLLYCVGFLMKMPATVLIATNGTIWTGNDDPVQCNAVLSNGSMMLNGTEFNGLSEFLTRLDLNNWTNSIVATCASFLQTCLMNDCDRTHQFFLGHLGGYLKLYDQQNTPLNNNSNFLAVFCCENPGKNVPWASMKVTAAYLFLTLLGLSFAFAGAFIKTFCGLFCDNSENQVGKNTRPEIMEKLINFHSFMKEMTRKCSLAKSFAASRSDTAIVSIRRV